MLWDTDYNYTNADLDDIYEDGKKRGKSIANQVAIEEMPMIGEQNDCGVTSRRDVIETEDDVKDEFMSNCAEAEECNRAFSPFEFIAKEINEREDADDAWEQFDDGINAGFEEVWDESVIQVTEEYAEEMTKEMLNETGGSIEIAGQTFRAGDILKEMDPVGFNQVMNDYMDPWEVRED